TYDWGDVVGQTTATIAGLDQGTYTVTVTDNNGCQAQKTFTVYEPGEIDFELHLVQDISCDGDGAALEIGYTDKAGVYTAGKISGGWPFEVDNATGGLKPATPKFKIDWSGEGIANATVGTTDAEGNILSYSDLTSSYSGVYRVTVTDASAGHNGCSLTKNYTFPTPIKATIESITSETCDGKFDGTVTVKVTGGRTPYTYLWETSDGAGLSETSANQVGLKAGTYTFTVFSADYKPADPATGAPEQGCKVTIDDIKVGKTRDIRIDEKITDVKCLGGADGAIDLTTIAGGSGKYDFLWVGTADGLKPTQRSQSGLSRGQYTVTITDRVYGCVVTKNYTVGGADEKLLIDKVDVSQILCKDGTGVTTYSYTDATTKRTYAVSYDAVADEYSYTDDAGLKQIVAQADVTVSTDVDKNYGTIEVHAIGGMPGYTYDWSGDGTNFGHGSKISNLKAGKYQVTVTDHVGCQVTSDVINITEPKYALTANVDIDEVVNVKTKGGNDGEITVRVAGGTGSYNYLWTKTNDDAYVFNPSAVNRSHITGLTAGNYNVVVNDENGCQVKVENVHVSEPGELLDVIVAHTDVEPCRGSDNGTIDVDVHGGVVPYTIVCRDGEGNLIQKATNVSSLNITGLGAGFYTVDVTDGNNVSFGTQTVTIVQPETLELLKTRGLDVKCYDANTGMFTLDVVGGTVIPDATDPSLTTALKNYQIIVTGPDGYNDTYVGASKVYDNLHSGTYFITVIDGGKTASNVADNKFDVNDDCWLTDTIVIHQPEAFVALSKASVVSDFYACADDEVELKLIVSDWDVAKRPLKVVVRENDIKGVPADYDGVDLDANTSTEIVHTVNKSPYLFKVKRSTTSTFRIVNVYEDDANCGRGTFDTEAEMVVYRPRPTGYIHGDDEICLGSSIDATIDLTPTDASQAPWTVVVSDGKIDEQLVINETPYTYTYTPREATEYEIDPVTGQKKLKEPLNLKLIKVSDQFCEARNDTTPAGGWIHHDMTGAAEIIVNSIPSVVMTGSKTICKGGEAFLEFTVTGGTAPYTITYYYEHPLTHQHIANTITESKGEQQKDANGNYTDVYVIKQRVTPSTTTEYHISGIVDSKNCFPDESVSYDDVVTIYVKDLSDRPSYIEGDDIVCQGSEGIVYTTNKVASATGYKWTVPTGITIVTGQGSNTISVNIGQNFQSGEIGVQTLNDCNESQMFTKLISAKFLPKFQMTTVDSGKEAYENDGATLAVNDNGEQLYYVKDDNDSKTYGKDMFSNMIRSAGNASNSYGKVIFCQGEQAIRFNIPQIDYASEYEWSLPTGMRIVNGAGTSSIQVNVEEYVTPLTGEVKVRAKNSCGNGLWSEPLQVSINQKPKIDAGPDLTYCPKSDADVIVITPTTKVGDFATSKPVISPKGVWTVIGGGSTFSDGNRSTSDWNASVDSKSLTQNKNVYLWTVTDDNTQCYATDTVVIRNLDVNTSASVVNTIICDGTAEIQASDLPSDVEGITYTGLWTVVSTREQGVVINDANSPHTFISNLSRGETRLKWTVMANTCPTESEITLNNNEPDYPVIWVKYSNNGGEHESTVYSGVANDERITFDAVHNQYRIVVCSPDVELKGFHVKNPSVLLDHDPANDRANSDAIFGANQTSLWEQVTGGGAFNTANLEEGAVTSISGLTWGDNVINLVVRNGNCTKSISLNLYYGKLNLNAGEDGSTCDGTYQLNASSTGIPASAVAKWYNYNPMSDDRTITGVGTFDNARSANAKLTKLEHGKQTFFWVVDLEGCLSADSITISNNEVSDAEVTEKNMTICDGQEKDLMIKKNLNSRKKAGEDDYETGSWSIVKGYAEFGHYKYKTDANGNPVYSPSGDLQYEIDANGNQVWVNSPDYAEPFVKVRNVQRGQNVFIYRIASKEGGCSKTDTVIVTNYSINVDAGNDTSICSTQVQLHAKTRNYSKQSWSAYNSTFNLDQKELSNPDAWIGGLKAGRNYYVWTVTNKECASSDTVVITNNTPQFLDPDVTISGDSVLFSPNSSRVTDGSNQAEIRGASVKPGYGTGHWELGVGGGTIVTPNNVETVVSDLDLGMSTFKWIVVNNGCRLTGTYTVNNGYTKAANAGTDVYNLCSDTYQLQANGPYNGVGQWSVVYGSATFENKREPHTRVTGLQKGRNTLRWTITYNGGASSDTVQIWNMSVTEAYAGNDRVGLQSICGDSITIQGNDVKEGSYKYFASGKEYNVKTTHEWTLLSGSGQFMFNKNSEKVMLDKDKLPTLEAADSVSSISWLDPDKTPKDVYAQFKLDEAKFAKFSRNPSVVGLKQGSNTFIYKISNNVCDDVDTLEIFNDRADDAWACGLGNSCDTLYTCDGTIDLNPNSPTYGTGEWKVAPGGSAKFSGNHAYDLAPGTNTLIWEISTSKGGDCTTSSEVIIQNNKPTQADAGPDDPLTVCGSESVLSGNKPMYYTQAYWELVEGSGQFVQKDAKGDDVLTDMFSEDAKVLYKEVRNGTATDKIYEHYSDDGTLLFWYNTVSKKYFRYTLDADGHATANVEELNYVANIDKKISLPISGVVHSIDYKDAELRDATGKCIYTWAHNNDKSYSRKTIGVLVDKVLLRRGDGTDNQNLTVNGLAFGNNRFRWVIENGTGDNVCRSTDETVLNNIFIQAVAGSVQPLCTDTVRLTANNPAPGVGIWSIAAGQGRGHFEDPGDPHTIVRDLGQGNNVLVWTVNYLECPSTDTVVVLNNRPTQAEAKTSMPRLCDVNEVILTAKKLATLDEMATNSVEYGSWAVAEGSGTIVSPNNSTTLVKDIPFNTYGNRYQWRVYRVYNKSFTCVDYADVTVYYDKVEADAGEDAVICGTDYNLRGTSASPGVGEWSIIGAASAGSFEDFNDPTTKVTNLANGANVLRWTTSYNGCEDYDEVTIYNGNPSAPTAGTSKKLCVTEVGGKETITLDGEAPELGVGHWITMVGAADFENDSAKYIDDKWLEHEAELEHWTQQQRQDANGNDRDFSKDEYAKWYYSNTKVAGKHTNQEAMQNPKSIYNPKPTITVGPGDNTYRWVVEKRNAVPIMIRKSDGTADSTYVVQVKTCTLSDDVVVHNLTPSDPAVGSEPDPLCTDTYDLKAATPTYGTGIWTISGLGGGQIEDPTSPRTRISNLLYGVNNLKWTVSTNGNCAKSVYFNIYNMSPTKSEAGPDRPVCALETELQGNTPIIGEGHWEVASGYASDVYGNSSFENVNDPNTTLKNMIFGDNVYLWIIKNNYTANGKTFECQSVDTVVINYQIPDEANINGGDYTVCDDQTTLNANVPQYGTGSWTVLQGEGEIADTANAQSHVTNLSFGENIFRWTITYLNCKTQKDVVVTSYKAKPYAGENDVTYSSTYQLNAGNPGRLQGTWTVLGNADKSQFGGEALEFEDDHKYNSYVYGLSRGVNTFRWTLSADNGACEVYDEVSITYKVVPTASFDADYEEGCFPLTVRFTDGSQDATKYNWDFGDGTTSTIRNPTHTFQLPGNYEVKLTIPGPDGLSSDTIKYITVYDHPVASFDAAPQLVYIPEDKVHFINRSTG
ncbi:MAG: PKD domain-containing protein, partial [Bacteroidales bacterium]|nr:PKD domain-containing protein [Bacteroidales bacterium]